MDLKAIRFIEGTKVSHDYKGSDIKTFNYEELVSRGVPSIGIPCKINSLIVIDIDVIGSNQAHRHDGRQFWKEFSERNGIPDTYTVKTPSGGFHFYYRLPLSIDPEQFAPVGKLAHGVDVKWNGWVGAPPTIGYEVVSGTLEDIIVAPPSLIMALLHRVGLELTVYDSTDPFQGVHAAFTEKQIEYIEAKLKWVSANIGLTYPEWRDGIFSLKTGLHHDPEKLEELVMLWTHNQHYRDGDEHQAMQILNDCSETGNIGPGTILELIKEFHGRNGINFENSPLQIGDVFSKAGVQFKPARDGDGVSIQTSEWNIASIIGAMLPPEVLFCDTRTGQYMYKGKMVDDVELVNTLLPVLQRTKDGLGLQGLRKPMVSSAIDVLLQSRKRDPHVEWMNALVWDTSPRIETFFIRYLNLEDTPYHRAVSRNMWIALAARAIDPGIKFDSVVILEGNEGIRKSTLVETMARGYHVATETAGDFGKPEFIKKAHQSAIVELPELMGLIGQTGEQVKAILAGSADMIRDLYAKRSLRRPRGFIFVGTTNDYKYLTPEMGLRRFWPIRIPSSLKSINIPAINIEIEQLYAEAVARFRGGEAFHEVPSEHIRQVGSRIKQDPIVEYLSGMIAADPTRIWSTLDVFAHLVNGGMVLKGLEPKVVDRIEKALSSLGMQEKINGKIRTWSVETPEPDWL